MKNLKEHIESQLESEPILEMRQVGQFVKYSVYVYSNDHGNIPHFHVKDTATNGSKFHTCIEIKQNKYFQHGSKRDSFNNQEKKELDKFLHQKYPRNGEGNNWDFIANFWNECNPTNTIPFNLEQPNYSILKDTK